MRLSKTFYASLLLVGIFSQLPVAYTQTRPPLVYTTPPQTVPASLRLEPKQSASNQPAAIEINGKAAFTITAAQLDDTLTGTFIYMLSVEDRQKLASTTNQTLSQIPALLTKKDVKAAFQKETSCPWLRLKLNPATLEMNGLAIHLNMVTLEVPETRDYLGQLICHWARQINVNRQRRGIIAAINRALNEEQE